MALFGKMLLGILTTIVAFTATVFADCDVSALSESQKEFGLRVCQLEEQIAVVQRALQEVLQRTDITMDNTMPLVDKRKNEFIRFGKRSDGEAQKRKNEFIRFGKRKNEFIRFGRSDPALYDDVTMEKRKNEFIRFG